MSLKKHPLGHNLVLVYNQEKGVICVTEIIQNQRPGFEFKWEGLSFKSICLCQPCFNYLGDDIDLFSSKLNDFLFSEVHLSFVLYVQGDEVGKQLKHRMARTISDVKMFHGHF